MEKKTRTDESKGTEIALRIKRIQGDERPTFANNFVFQFRDDEFHIRFYQVVPPIVLGETEDERKAEIDELNGVIEAPCVSHIVLSGPKMLEFVNTLNEHVKKHSRIDSTDEERDED